MKTRKEIHKSMAKSCWDAARSAGLAELHALERKFTRYYDDNLISGSELGKLDVFIMERIARFDCIK